MPEVPESMPERVPLSIDGELEIVCDNSNAMYDEVARVLRRHMYESAVTHWQVVGMLEVFKAKIIHGERI